MILADDIGPETLSVYGGQSYSTPVLDAMAAKGVTFLNAYSMPSCTPTRVHFLSGRSNVRNYVYFSCMDPNERTFVQDLKNAGYRTGAAGKWQLRRSQVYPEFYQQGLHPTDAGFEEWCLWQVDESGERYFDPLIETHQAPPTVRVGEYGPDIFNAFAIDFIENHKSEPFFLYYPMVLGHGPFHTPPGRTPSSNIHINFGNMLSYADQLIGNLAMKLEQLGIADNTLVIFAGDNGTSQRVPSKWNGHYVYGGKGATSQFGLHAPLIAYWPNNTSPGSYDSDLLEFTDFYPTFLEMAGLDMPRDKIYDGISFLDRLKGTNSGKSRKHVYGWFWPKPDKVAQPAPRTWIVTDEWKLYGTGQFFHSVTDRLERRNLQFSANPIVVAARNHCQALLDGYPSMPPAWGGLDP